MSSTPSFVFAGVPVPCFTPSFVFAGISPDKARKGVIYTLKKGIYALVEISERTFMR